MSDLFTDTRKVIARLAAESFANHVLTSEGPNEWHCGKPGTGIYSFRVLCRPGMVTVWGDIGEWILRHSDRDSIGWLRGSVSSPDYLLSKVKAGEHEKFYAADALAELNGADAADMFGAECVEKVKEHLTYAEDTLSQHEWLTACYESGMDDPPAHNYPSERALWLIESLQKFVALETASK